MTNETTFLIDSFAFMSQVDERTIRIRLFPFGSLFKNGKERQITPEYAATFKLPHFKPPLKIGSHNNDAPGGGFIKSLEVGEDGLYGLITTTEKGAKTINEKLYKYHSPEVIWDNGWLEHPSTGEKIRGPLIVGDALLHTPHLGEGAALYSIEPAKIDEGEDMSEQQDVVSLGALEKMLTLFGFNKQEEAEVDTQPEPVTDKFEAEMLAAKARVDELETQLADNERQANFNAKAQTYATELDKEGTDIHELLAGLEDETAQAILGRFKALYAQIEHRVDEHIGGQGAEDDSGTPIAQLTTLIEKYQADNDVDYNEAVAAISRSNPELVGEHLYGGSK